MVEQRYDCKAKKMKKKERKKMPLDQIRRTKYKATCINIVHFICIFNVFAVNLFSFFIRNEFFLRGKIKKTTSLCIVHYSII